MQFGLHCQILKISKSLSKIRRSGILETAALFHEPKEKWLNKQLRKAIYFSIKSNLFLLRETEENYSVVPEKDQSKPELLQHFIFLWHSVLSPWAVTTITNKTKFHRAPQIRLAAVHSPLSWEFIISVNLLLSCIFGGGKLPEATRRHIQSTSEI